MTCKHKYIAYNRETGDFICLECREWISSGNKAPKEYSCSDTPGVFQKQLTLAKEQERGERR